MEALLPSRIFIKLHGGGDEVFIILYNDVVTGYKAFAQTGFQEDVQPFFRYLGGGIGKGMPVDRLKDQALSRLSSSSRIGRYQSPLCSLDPPFNLIFPNVSIAQASHFARRDFSSSIFFRSRMALMDLPFVLSVWIIKNNCDEWVKA